jgi:alpha-L-fucosidase
MEFDSDVQDLRYADLYGPAQPGPRHGDRVAWKHKDWQPRPNAAYLEDWLARCCELVDKYQPQVFWFDWWIEQIVFAPYLQRFAATYYNRGLEWGVGVAINHKYDSFPKGTTVFDIERGQLSGIRDEFWQTDTSVSKNSWSYVENQDYKTIPSLIHDLVDIVSKNGALLLNIGPKPDGTIAEPEQEMLLEIGRWLAVNGEAIYGTRPWRVSAEDEVRYTQKENALYAITLGWPGTSAVLRSLGTAQAGDVRVQGVSLLGSSETLLWSRDKDALTIQAPAEKPGPYAYAFKVNLR